MYEYQEEPSHVKSTQRERLAFQRISSQQNGGGDVVARRLHPVSLTDIFSPKAFPPECRLFKIK